MINSDFMKKVIVLVLLFSLVLSVSGCVEGGSLGDLMGVGAEETEQPNDVLSIKNPIVDPSTVNADNPFEFSFELKNLFDAESAKNVEVKLYNTGMCDLKDDSPARPIKKEEEQDIYEGASRVMEWNLEAPSNEQLGNMVGSCPLKYYVEYEFNAYSRSDLYVVGEDASSSSEVSKVSPTTSKARGPLKIDVEFSGKQPFDNGNTIPFQIRLRNAGKGKLESLKPEHVDITLVSSDGEEQELGGDNYLNEGDGGWETGCMHPVEKRSKTLPFIDGKTPPISCRLYKDDGYGEYFEPPLSSFQIEVDIKGYVYTLYGEKTVTVEPTLRG